MTGHEFSSGRFTGAVICQKCGLMPFDDDHLTPCPNDWVEVGELGEEFDVGGDTQVGNAWSRRWQRRLRDGNWEVVTVNAYAVELKPDEEPGVYDVEVQTETVTCTDPEDPGSTEVNSDYEYEYLNDVAFTVEADATTYAKTYVSRIDTTHM